MAKRFVICERESNGEFARMSKYATRTEATDVLAKIFKNDADADPQNFKIVEEEFDGEDEFELLIYNVLNRISHLGKFRAEFGTVDGLSHVKKCATLKKIEPFPVWTGTVIKIVMDMVGDKGSVTISANMDGEADMLIAEVKC